MAIFIGDNVLQVPYDFGTKVADSVVECSLDFYEQDIDINNIPIPTDVLWKKNTIQSDIDLIKFQDNNLLIKNTIALNKSKGILIEVDFTNICTVLYNGDNPTFKTNILTSLINLYAIGSGYNSKTSALANGLSYKIWNGSAWVDLGNNTDSIIQKNTSNFDNTFITSDNKLYIVLYSTYLAYNQILKSSISMNYINIELFLNRNPDVVSPIPINLV